MKSHALYPGLLLCFISLTNCEAQVVPPVNQNIQKKAPLFTRLPDKLRVSSSLLEKIFTTPVDSSIRIPFADTDVFYGIIVEKVQKNEHVVTVNIRSLNYDGAFFSLSRIADTDQRVTYIGRIISLNHGDVLVLKKENEQFLFVKANQSYVITE